MQSFSLGQNQISILPGRRPDAPVIYLPSVKDEGACISRYLLEYGCPDLTLVSISDLSWNHDMAPWDCPSVFPKGDPFTGGADAYIHQLTEQILPEAERRIGSEPVWRGIAGYSLAGLFAIYTLYHTDLFSRAASMSGSLWFPGFSEYMESHSLPPSGFIIELMVQKSQQLTFTHPKYSRKESLTSRKMQNRTAFRPCRPALIELLPYGYTAFSFHLI